MNRVYEVHLKDLVCGDYRFLCVGTELRRDDAAGLRLCDLLESGGFPGGRLVRCEFGLENCVSAVERVSVRKAVLIDAMIPLRLEVGDVDYVLTDFSSVEDKISLVTTHSIPVKFVVDMLRGEGLLGEVMVLGIVARDLNLGEGLSQRVQEAVDHLSRTILDLWRDCPSRSAGLEQLRE